MVVWALKQILGEAKGARGTVWTSRTSSQLYLSPRSYSARYLATGGIVGSKVHWIVQVQEGQDAEGRGHLAPPRRATWSLSPYKVLVPSDLAPSRTTRMSWTSQGTQLGASPRTTWKSARPLLFLCNSSAQHYTPGVAGARTSTHCHWRQAATARPASGTKTQASSLQSFRLMPVLTSSIGTVSQGYQSTERGPKHTAKSQLIFPTPPLQAQTPHPKRSSGPAMACLHGTCTYAL